MSHQALGELDDMDASNTIDLPPDVFEDSEVLRAAADHLQPDRVANGLSSAGENNEADDEFDVEEILKERPATKTGARAQFLIRWLGYGPEHDTWEPEDCITPELVAQFRQKQEA